MKNKEIIKSPFAGTWYPDDPDKLKNQLGMWCGKAPGAGEKEPVALILPHAGYEYSGKCAASAIKYVKGRFFDRVVVLAPSHRVCLNNRICVPVADSMETPLGEVRIDRTAISMLRSSPLVVSDNEIPEEEHSLQLQIPFLQYALKPGFSILPIVIGIFEDSELQKLCELLKPLFVPGTLLVASSDFTHFGSSFRYQPFHTDIRENLEKLDMGAFDFIQKGNAVGFADYLARTGATVCGAVPIQLLLKLLPGGAECVRTDYSNSAQVSGDWNDCVSYVSAVFYGDWDVPHEKTALTESDKKILLGLARAAIAQNLGIPYPVPDETLLSKAAVRKAGAFVTLRCGARLRGCIGEIAPYRKLMNAVKARAVDAAFNDPRFSPLRPEEFEQTVIEISALTPPRPVSSYREIELGKHGIVLSKANRNAVFLPQVPLEQEWNLDDTLTNLALKAGLPPDAWKHDAAFEVFEAVVFSEKE